MGLVLSGVGLLVFGYAASSSSPRRTSAGADCSSLAVDPGLVAIGHVQIIGAVLTAVGLVPHEVRTKVTVTPSLAGRGGPFVGFSENF